MEGVATGVLCGLVLGSGRMFGDGGSVRKFAAVSGTVVGIVGVAGGWTGGLMNPAMHGALAWVGGMWGDVAVYWMGPFVGAVVVGGLFRGVRRRVKVD